MTKSVGAVSLKAPFDEYSGSFLGSQLVFSCGRDTFKLHKSVVGNHTLYWKSGLDWAELENVSLRSTGITFTGLITTRPFTKSVLNIKPDLLIYNGPKKPDRYFTVVNKEVYFPLKHTVDFYNSEMTEVNSSPAIHQLSLNRDEYINDQKKIGSPYSFSSERIDLSGVYKYESKISSLELELKINPGFSEASRKKIPKLKLQLSEAKRMLALEEGRVQIAKDKKRTEDQKDSIKRINEITQSANEYQDGLVVTVPAGGYKRTYDCWPR